MFKLVNLCHFILRTVTEGWLIALEAGYLENLSKLIDVIEGLNHVKRGLYEGREILSHHTVMRVLLIGINTALVRQGKLLINEVNNCFYFD